MKARSFIFLLVNIGVKYDDDDGMGETNIATQDHGHSKQIEK